jgi:hypothetical protein
VTTRQIDIPAVPPDYLTVEEVGAILRIGRGSAYAGVRLFVASGGTEGIPAERHSKQFRIPRYAIEAPLGGPVTWPIPGYHPIPPNPETQPIPHPRPKRPADPDSQPRLFLA